MCIFVFFTVVLSNFFTVFRVFWARFSFSSITFSISYSSPSSSHISSFDFNIRQVFILENFVLGFNNPTVVFGFKVFESSVFGFKVFESPVVFGFKASTLGWRSSVPLHLTFSSKSCSPVAM
uniref:Uncharacterized protein n=1 Tax=Cacopsylla melanoneura TaxID=428564 RepID=A0A8D8LX76_9HEMI